MATPNFRTPLNGLFDDAGLFAPARRPMAQAMIVHGKARGGPYAELVGPFMCPAGRLEELDACASAGVPRPEHVSVMLYPGDRQLGRAINRPGVVQVEAPFGMRMPDEATPLRRFVELPPTGEIAPAVTAIARSRASVKLRFGGGEPYLVPTVDRVAETLLACVARGARLKASGGLRQPFCRRAPGAGGMRYGFVNLLAAASAAAKGASHAELVSILSTVEGTEEGSLLARIDQRARDVIVSIGVCSLDEPIAKLAELGLLRRNSQS